MFKRIVGILGAFYVGFPALQGAPTSSVACDSTLDCCVSTLNYNATTAPGAQDGPIVNASFNAIFDLKFDDTQQLLFIADDNNNCIRVLNASSQNVSTLAGLCGSTDTTWADGVGTSSVWWNPKGIIYQGSTSTLWASDSSHNLIRSIHVPTGAVVTRAGLTPPGVGTVGSFLDGIGTAARLYSPRGLALDCAQAALYICDNSNSRVRVMALSTFAVTTLLGSGTAGSLNGFGVAAQLNQPRGLGFNVDCSLLVIADGSANKIRGYVAATGWVYTLVGAAAGFANGRNTTALLNNPTGIYVDAPRNRAIIGDAGNQLLRNMSLTDFSLTTLAGAQGGVAGFVDGPATTAAKLSTPKVAITRPSDGAVLFSDSASNALRIVVCPAALQPSGTRTPSQSPTLTSGYSISSSLSRTPTVTPSASPSLSPTPSLTVSTTNFMSVSGSTTPTPGVCQVDTVAGLGTATSVDGVGQQATFSGPFGLALDEMNGQLYVTDANIVRKVDTATFTVTTIAGANVSCSNTSIFACDGTGTTGAKFNGLSMLNFASSPAGGLLVTAEQGGARIRTMNLSSLLVKTIGGTGTSGSRDGALGVSAFSGARHAVYCAALGMYYVSDTGNFAIRGINGTTLNTSTLAGGPGSGTANGVGRAAKFLSLRGIELDGAEGLFIADYSAHTIRRMDLQSLNVTTVAGVAASFGGLDGALGANRLNSPFGLAMDGMSGRLFISEVNRLRYMSVATTVVTTLANFANANGYQNGFAARATLGTPKGLAATAGGSTIYVADSDNNLLRRVRCTGPPIIGTNCSSVSTLAGNGNTSALLDGPGASAQLYPWGLAGPSADGSTLYFSDYNRYIRAYNFTSERVVTLAGNASGCISLMGTRPASVCDGVGTAGVFEGPSGLALDVRNGNLYITDQVTHTLRVMSTQTLGVSTVCNPNGTAGISNGGFGMGALNGPRGVWVNTSGSSTVVLVADTGNNNIRSLDTATRVLSTLAGSPTGVAGYANGLGTSALFNQVRSIDSVPGTSVVYVTDYTNMVLRRVDVATGSVSLFCGTASSAGSQDGPCSNVARFNSPFAVVFDAMSLGGSLYVTDYTSQRLRRVFNLAGGGTVQTLINSAGTAGARDGPFPLAATLGSDGPKGIAVVPGGGLVYVADYTNGKIRTLDCRPSPTPTPTTSPTPSRSPTASPSLTPSPSGSTSSSVTGSGSGTGTGTVSSSGTPSSTVTAAASLSLMPSPSTSAAATQSLTSAVTPTQTVCASPSPSPTLTATPTTTLSAGGSASSSGSTSLSGTATPSGSPTQSPTGSSGATPSPSSTTSSTGSSAPTLAPGSSPSASPTPSPTPSTHASLTLPPSLAASAQPPSLSPTAPGSPTPAASASDSGAAGASGTGTPSTLPSASSSSSGTATLSATPCSSATGTGNASASATASLSGSNTLSFSSTASLTSGASASNTGSTSLSSSQSATGTPSQSRTGSATVTATSTVSGTGTAAATPTTTLSTSSTVSASPTASLTSGASPSSTGSISQSPSLTPSLTASSSATGSATGSASAPLTLGASPSNSASSLLSASATHTPTPTAAETPSSTLSGSSTVSASPTASLTAGASPSVSASASLSGSATPLPTPTATATPTPTGTSSGTAAGTPSSTLSSSSTVSALPTASLTAGASPSASASASLSGSTTPLPTPSPTMTPTPTSSGTATAAATPSTTASGSSTVSATPTATLSSGASPSNSASVSFSASATPQPTPSPTLTPTPSSTGTGSGSSTASASPTATLSVGATPSISGSAPLSPSPTPTPTPSPTGTGSPTPTGTPSASLSLGASPSQSTAGSSSLTPTATASASAAPGLALGGAAAAGEGGGGLLAGAATAMPFWAAFGAAAALGLGGCSWAAARRRRAARAGRAGRVLQLRLSKGKVQGRRAARGGFAVANPIQAARSLK